VKHGVQRRNGVTGAILIAVLSSLSACGGGGGGSDNDNDDSGGGNASAEWTPGEFLPSSRFDAECVSPRSGFDPTTGQPWPDVAGSSVDENNWLRAWSNELYLWYDEIEDLDPNDYSTPEYFALLKTFQTTSSGADKDKFHFTYPTDDWIALSQSGVTASYGATWSVLADLPPRQVVIAYTEPGSPATDTGLERGAEVLAVDGVDLIESNDVDTLNFGLWPASAGEDHTFTIRDLDSGQTRIVTMRSANVTSTPVQSVRTIATATGTVGYMLFNDHIATAEQGLIDAIEQLDTAQVTDLVLDIRYNGGGYLDIASELGYMIAGAGAAGRTFEQQVFNDKHPVTNPVTGAALVPLEFHSTTQGFSTQAGEPLPTLDLSRVVVLTGPDTCSASEAIINSLRGIDVDVIQIGSTTCGKPYGFYPADNCGTTYFSIQFKGVNAKNYGEYTDGFTPSEFGNVGSGVPGCAVADDYTHALGDVEESRLSAALRWLDGFGCEPARAESAGDLRESGVAASRLAAVDGRLSKSPWLMNRTLRR
jgi:C-terminal processing protease CtpA/Prc